jgi:type IV secretory pathway ATPase VirB11/archaellum biosynthesis ATPase
MEFHTEEEAMMYGKRLAINSKEDVSIYKRIVDINYKEKIDINIYGN